MAKSKGVSSKKHTQKQLDNYANQYNPNNKAYQARVANHKKTKNNSAKHYSKKQAKFEEKYGVMYPLEWFCYSNPYDFE